MRIAFLIGNLGNQPEILTTNRTTNGTTTPTTYCNLRVAYNERLKHRDPVTEWYGVVAFGKLAETLVHLDLGDEVAVVGPFHQVSFTDQHGVKHRIIEIRAWDIKFLRRANRDRAGEAEPAGTADAAEILAAAMAGLFEGAGAMTDLTTSPDPAPITP